MDLNWLYKAFWNERVWLPPNTTWTDLENKPGDPALKPQAADLWLTLPIAVVVYIIRYAIMNVVAVKLGLLFNIHPSNTKITVERIAALEAAYRRNKKPDRVEVEALASKANLSVERVSKWYRDRRNQEKSSKLSRLQDSLWKLIFYGATWTFGMYHFSTQPWAKNLRECWLGYPNHNLDDEIKWFYLAQMGLYVMCAVTHFFDVRRTDFWAMIIHHVVTLALMAASYINNHVRIGCLILITHDIADVNMEFAKTINYLGFSNGSQYAFVSFVVCWIVTRLTYFPMVIIRSVHYDSREILGDEYLFQRGFFVLLLILFGLHVFWFTLIVRMVIMKLKRGRIEGDVRSDSELESADENGNDSAKNGCNEGSQPARHATKKTD